MSVAGLLLYAVVMAAVTYLVRMLPMVVFRKKIKNGFIRSFLYYIPYAVLGAMTFPAILSSTACVTSAAVGLAIALIMAFFERSLLTVALTSCVSVFICEAIIRAL